MTAATTAADRVRDQQVLTILQRSVCLTLDCHYLGNNRKVDLDEFVNVAAPDREEPDAGTAIDESAFSVTMRLIDPAILRPVLRVLGRVKS